MTLRSAISTQSAGVPWTAKRRSSRRRSLIGLASESECEAPDCSTSGATIHTSSVRVRAIVSSVSSPSAWMPSSLVTRTVRGGSAIGANDLAAVHIGAKRVRDQDRAVGPLVILEHGDEGPPDRQARAGEGVDIAPPPAAPRAVARLHPAGLEVAAHRAARYFAVGALAGEPDFEIVGHAGAETHVAGAQLHHPIRQGQKLEHLLGSRRHALELVARSFGGGDRDEL